ncbi:MAG: histidinol-phosphate transaminase [Verrucomicrobiota bacterium]
MSILDQVHAQLRDLHAYEPGKPIEDVARELGLEPSAILKLASNENPLGPSPRAVAAMTEALPKAHLYPDGGGWKLRTAIAEKFDLDRENVVLGNGSNEIIELLGHSLLKPGTSTVVSDHAFVVYKLMSTLFGAETIEVPEKPGFQHDLEAMAAAIRPDTREVFIANPNNPTGTLVTESEIERFLDRVPEEVVVVFDEAYYEFLDSPPDTLRFVREGRNVVVMRTFSKIQGLSALRIGYGLAPQPLAEVLQKCRQPFNANAIAQAGALAGLLDQEHQDRTKSVTDEGRVFFQGAFAEMGLEFIPSFANFVLVKVGDGEAVFREMMARGIILRAMASYKLPEWVRISIGTPSQNERCLEELQAVLAAQSLA